MKKKAIIVDVEATCSDKDEFPREEMEIIEIGATCIDENNDTVDTFQAFIRPVVNPTLTEFCKSLTTITQDDVDSADTFANVMTSFLKWVEEKTGGEYTFYSWGNFDRNIFRRECIANKVDARKFLSNHVNAKQVFANENGKVSGVGSAMKAKKMKFVGTAHRAIDDAINITELVKTLKERQ